MDSHERSEAQQEASRQNGAKSSGPATAEGRRRSAENSTKHGLFSSRVVLVNESQELFDRLLQSLIDEHKPVGPTEEHLVEDMAVARWKMRRLYSMEAAGYDTDMFIHRQSFDECFQPNDPGMRHHDAASSINTTQKGLLEFYDRSLGRLHRVYRNSLADLLRLQARRSAASHSSPRKEAPKSAPGVATPPPQPVDPITLSEKVRNEPGSFPNYPPIHLKTYIEPEAFAFCSKVDHAKLNPLAFQSAKGRPLKDDFSKFFKPAA
ncbi:MAG: hypothetical protein JNK48_17710 [Bryobacterales bacterium]|nr:hypothetical protein [Bryobacterales bacterium]